MFDAHNHLQFADFDVDRDDVLDRAATAGVRGMVLAGYDDGRRELARELATRPGIGATAGLHPWGIGEDFEQQLRLLEALDWSGFCGVGELGLDWVRAKTDEDRARQVDVFRRQLGIARDLGLPVVLHCVRANDHLAKWVRTDGLPARGGLVHSFWGSAQQAARFVDLGLHLSIGTQITHAQPDRMVESAKLAGLERLLVETDAPSRPPMGVDVDRNEPAFLGHVVDAVAEVLGEDPERVADATEANARELFGIDGVLPG